MRSEIITLFSLGLALAISLSACASYTPKPNPSVSEPDLELEQQRLRDVAALNKAHYGRGFPELQTLIAAPAFASLEVEDQFQALTWAVDAAPGSETTVRRRYLDRAIALPGIEFEDLQVTLRTALNLDYAAGAIRSLTLLAERWPDRVGSLEVLIVRRALFMGEHVSRQDRLRVLQALYAARWKPEWGIEPSESWRNLALLLLEQGRMAEGIEVSIHITGAYVLAAMRADRRFDSVVAANLKQFDVDAAAVTERKRFQALSEEHPKSLLLKVGVLEALLHERHYAAMLAESDEVVQAIKFTNFPERLYDDYVEQHSRYFFLRSLALQREGRWDEALAQAVDASHEGDVNELINLANLYWALDRPKDALSLLSTIGPSRVSPYGAMQVETIRLQAAVRAGDREQTARSLKYLSEHRADAPADYSVSLLVTEQMDAAAAYLVTQLKDPDLRQDALLDAQEYPPTPGTDLERKLEVRWRAVVSRKEVQAEIRKVGRIEKCELEAP